MFPPASGQKYASLRFRLVAVLLVSLLLISVPSRFIRIIPSAHAAVPIPTAAPVVQNFDSIGTGATATLPTDFRADRTTTATAADMRKVGTYAAASTATTQVGGANLSTSATNGIYNFGSGTTTAGADRAIGFLASGTGTASGNLYTQLLNNTGGSLTGLVIAYDVEKYRNGTNAAGFRIQLFYSTDGTTWTSAGNSFLTAFGQDPNSNGFSPAPGVTVPVSSTLNVAIPSNGNFYLAWNYSVTANSTVTNAQALAVDNISIKGVAGSAATNPTGVGSANPSSVAPTQTTLLTVAVTPGTNPTSTAHTVAANLSSIGGSSAQTFFDDGSNGDATPNDNVFSYLATVASGTTGGAKTLPFTITETAPNSRTGSGNISLTVLSSTNPTGTGSASPSSVLPGDSSLLTVNVTPGTNPASTGLTVTADLSSIGGSATQVFSQSGNTFTYSATVASGTTPGAKTLPVAISDAQGRTGSTSIALTVDSPPPPQDHIVISQVYGGGGNSGATYQNDFVELFNPDTVAHDLSGWSIQYGAATGTTWQVQPLGGTMQPGEYYLIKLATGGANGASVPAANVDGSINLSGTTGKVALSNAGDAFDGCPVGDPALVDLVGYGTTANCREGATNAPAPSNTTSVFRKANGYTDTNVNGNDFATGTPNPRRTTPIVELGPSVLSSDPRNNGTNAPRDATITINFTEPVTVDDGWFNINCATTGAHNSATVVSGGANSWLIIPNVNFQAGEQCTVNVVKEFVHDADTDDATPANDQLSKNYSATFTVATGTAPPYTPEVHLTMGNPSNAVADHDNSANNYLMVKPEFTMSYDRDKGRPNWVSWHLSDEWFGTLTRVDTFRADPAVPADWYRVTHLDYSGSGFDRGHMTPNADRDKETSIPINQATFLMSNMIPQAPDNNQGPWANMENALRTIAGSTNELYIVAGGAGTGGTGSNGGVTTTIAGGHVSVPASTWKVVLVLPKGEDDVSRVTCATRTIAVIMPNKQGIRSDDWQNYITTVDAVEALTGYDFFSNLPEPIQRCVEAGTNGVNPPLDSDNDSVPDSTDNCDFTANVDQADTDHDGAGNACDADDDNDGVPDASDAFPLDPNESVDTDHDGIGNNADPDDDNDGVADAQDAFPLDPNESADTDHDGIGNNADADDDNDGQTDVDEIACGSNPLDANVKATDTDGDHRPDCVDTDDDGDGVPDTGDNCPLTANADQANADGDALGDVCDPDDDNDGVLDGADLCPGTPANTQVNAAGCPDGDGDGVADANDNCPSTANADQTDTDHDGAGNACDADDDNDGVPDASDAFPLDPNESVDTDHDGIGNNADPDDDNDGVSDAAEIAAGSDPLNAASTPEVCDGVDNDLDGSTDEGFVNTDGDAKANCVDDDDDNDGVSDTAEVAAGSDPLNANSTPEVCDGVDNDLNDGVDEGFVNTDGDAQANCVDADDDNDGASDVDEAAAGSDPLNANSTPEVCDGVDNDLNDGVDEGFVNTDGDAQANCVDDDDDNDGASDSVEIAAGSDPLNANSTPEVCDGIDNDLDGSTDEGFVNTDGDAQANCVDDDDDNDGVSDAAETTAGSDPLNAHSTPEVCDGVDNDLNDGVDEGFTNTDGDAQANCVDADDDNDGVSDSAEIAAGSDPLNAASTPEVCDGVDNDLDGSTDEGFVNTDGDAKANCVDNDDDNDGVPDASDAFPLDPNESVDTDHDGIGNNADPDDDNDGVADAQDAFPLDPNESADTDHDGIGNNADADDDNDGQTDVDEIACGSNPLDANVKATDTDGDHRPDCVDTDDDNDGVPDAQDAFPLDPHESVDTDHDGIGNNADTDDDGDGQTDVDENACGSDPLIAASKATDTDGDHSPNCVDNDDDNDGVPDASDAFPLNPNESVDTDHDGTGNNADPDDDNDGVVDAQDAFPLDPTESVDTDGDGMGNNADMDDDNDGVLDVADNCRLTFNPNQADFDHDGIGDTCDPVTGPPTNKEQCKSGGWQRFTAPRHFNNQGDCIQYVNTGK